MRPTRSPYNGTEKKLVLALDIGTTFSGVSFCILDPGHVPEICDVTRYPAQKAGGGSKIPTIIYYDQTGQVRACGAEATQGSIREQAIAEDWVLAEWFKLHMRPQSISTSDIHRDIPKLPPGKSVVDIIADFMKYLYGCASTYIKQTHANGASLWQKVEGNIEYVLSHPNGWEGLQQQQMRRAAVKAGLIPDTPMGEAKISFVTEGEASLHFCIQKGLTVEPIKNGNGVLIVDCGGGTIDLSAYGQSSDTQFEEIAAPECYLQGSVFVTSRALTYLNEYLEGSKFHDDANEIIAEFDQSAKLTFEDKATPLYIRFGRPRDFDSKFNIRAGQLCLPGNEVANFFQPSVDCIINAITEQRRKATKKITSIFLVGGFSASGYVFAQIQNAPALADVDVCRPDCHLNKAVADGAISFYLDGFVNARVSKFVYGIKCNTLYDPSIESHWERRSKIYTSLEGIQRLPDAFDVILPKGKQVSKTQEFRRSYQRLANESQISKLVVVKAAIIVYRGSSTPQWMDIDQDDYATLCYVEADTSELFKSLTPRWHDGLAFYKMNYDIVMSFGLTEFKAQISWMENDCEKRSPARVVYDALG